MVALVKTRATFFWNGSMDIDDFEIPRTMRVHEKATPMAARRTGCLFGLAPAEVGQSVVLEIGCGAGANLISLGLLYPSAKFKGMDESKSLCC